ncbi:MAG: hypothetical protein LBH46_03855, partial [Rickettsiales bacterium]|nr:hypothetical protein [Rickettsiales bacterium]
MENVSSNVCYLKREQIASFLGVSQEKADLYLFYAKDVETKKNGTKYFNIDELKDIQKSQEQKELAKENKRKADTNQTCAKNAQVGKVNTEEEEYLTIEQVAKKLGIERNTAIEKLSKVGVKAIKSKTLKNKNGVALNVYSNKEITEVSEQQQQATLAKIDNKAEKILDKEGAIVVANSFKKVLEEADPFEVLKMTTALNQLSMEKMFDLLNTKDRTISILDEKVSS